MLATRVRFAPSPTGPLHMGGIRTALYNYLFAKKNKGTFILRLEDTDQARLVKDSENYILEALRWAGIFPDEGFGVGGEYGPYKQSQRKEIYFSFIEKLLEKGLAYYAFDKLEDLENFRKEAELKNKTFIYGPLNRDNFDHSLKLTKIELQEKLKKKEPYVIRFKTPIKKNFKIFDQIRGEIFIDTELLDDKVLLKSDGMPTYHLASVVDDHLMKISHVIRGEEWLPSLSFHFLLYEAFDWEPPKFAHLPLILNPNGGGKLSKRHSINGNNFLVFPLNWEDPKTNILYKGYREAGFFPESFINMLALLGWNSGSEKEIFSMQELINEFSIEKISKSGARFSPEKALWINGQYLQNKSLEELTTFFCEEFSTITSNFEKAKLKKIINEIRPRVNFIYEIWDQGAYFFESPKNYEEQALKKIKSYSLDVLKKTKNLLEKTKIFDQAPLKKEIEVFVDSNNLKFTQLIQTIRLSLVGALRGVDLFFILEIIGKKESLNRIERLISHLEK